jgi:hypothetical protein
MHAQMLKPGGFYIPNYKSNNNKNDNRGPTYNKKASIHLPLLHCVKVAKLKMKYSTPLTETSGRGFYLHVFFLNQPILDLCPAQEQERPDLFSE